MKKLLAALVCWLSLLPGVSSANIAFDWQTFEATSSEYKITFSWTDGDILGASVDGLYGLLLLDVDAWKAAKLTSWTATASQSWADYVAKALRSTQGKIGSFNDDCHNKSGTFDWIVSGLTIGDEYLVGIGGWWPLAQGGQVSITAVPEPETYAMFLAGLGLIGVIARRRRAK